MFASRQIIPKLTRGFAAAAPSAASGVKAPIQMHSLDGRYATALFTAASKIGTLKAVEGDLQRFREAVAKDEVFQSFLASPVTDRKMKVEAVTKVANAQKYDQTTVQFLKLLGENGRLDLLFPKVLDAFEAQLAAHRGEVKVVVTSARPLDTKTLTRLRDALSKGRFTSKGQSLVMTNQVNPSILGGLIVDIGGESTIDMSASSRVAKIQEAVFGSL